MPYAKMKSGGGLLFAAVACSILLTVGVTGAADAPPVLEGVLQVITPEDGQSYFAVDGGKEIEAPSDAGGMRRGRVLQIAGLDEAMVAEAARLVGKRVVVEGRPFGAFTVHHYTEVLWLVTGLKEAK